MRYGMSQLIIATVNAIINAGFYLSVESSSIMWDVELDAIKHYYSEQDKTLYPCYKVDSVVFCQSSADKAVMIVK